MSRLNGRWDWWNEYTEKDELLDCMIILEEKLGRWPTMEEVTEIWPDYTRRNLQGKFGSYETAKSEAARKVYYRAQGYRTRENPNSRRKKLTQEQVQKIAEILARPRPTTTPKPEQRQEAPQPVIETQIPEKSLPERLETVSQAKKRGRKQTYSDAQLLVIAKQMIAMNGGQVPTMAQARAFLRQQTGPSLITMTNRLGPMAGWESRLKEVS